VLRDDLEADVVLVGDEVEEARCGSPEVDFDGLRVGRLGRIDVLGDVAPQRTFAPIVFRLVSVKATSSAVKGLPSLQLMPGRILMVSDLKSGLYW